MTDKVIPFPQRVRLTEKLATQIVDATRAGRSQRLIAREAGVSESTLRGWLDRVPEFGKRVAQARDEAVEAKLRRRNFTGSRPRTPERVAAVLTALAGGCSRTAACARAGIHPQTLGKWVEEDTGLDLQIQEAEARCQEVALSRIRAAAEEPRNWTAAAWLLERRWPEVYAKRFEMPHSERVRQAARIGTGLADALVKGLGEAGLEAAQQEKVRRLLVDELEKAAQAS